MPSFLRLLFLLMPLAANATIYQYVDNNGNVTFSDVPQAQAQQVQLPQVNSYQSAGSASAISNTPATLITTQQQTVSQSPAVTYTDFKITSLTDQQTFQNLRQIPVDITINPSLQPNDVIQILVDGKSYARQSNTRFTLDNLDRGTHTIQAQLINANDKIVMATPAITIYVHYAQANQPALPLLLPVTAPSIPLQPPSNR